MRKHFNINLLRCIYSLCRRTVTRSVKKKMLIRNIFCALLNSMDGLVQLKMDPVITCEWCILCFVEIHAYICSQRRFFWISLGSFSNGSKFWGNFISVLVQILIMNTKLTWCHTVSLNVLFQWAAYREHFKTIAKSK